MIPQDAVWRGPLRWRGHNRFAGIGRRHCFLVLERGIVITTCAAQGSQAEQASHLPPADA